MIYITSRRIESNRIEAHHNDDDDDDDDSDDDDDDRLGLVFVQKNNIIMSTTC